MMLQRKSISVELRVIIFLTFIEEAMKKLLDKINKEDIANENDNQIFESKLADILAKYKVNNSAFKVEVLNLHKEL